MRVEFTGDINNKSKDKEIYEEAAKRAVAAIQQGKQVVFDTTNLTKDKRRPFIEAIKKAIPNANIQYKLMPLDAELAKQRIKAQIEEYNKAKKEANARPSTTNIPQNLQSGVEKYGTLQYANKEAQKLLGKNVSSIEMITNGFRTRTTRTDEELKKYDIKVGSYIKMFGKDQFGNTINIIVQITKITKGYADATWYKEGWTEEGLEKLKKHTNSGNAVEFKVVTERANVPDETIDRHAESYKQMLEDIKSEGITDYDTQPSTSVNPLVEAGVKPTDMYGNAAKDIQMAEESTQFIGFGTIMKEGNVSSTDKYAKAWGNKTNTGTYTANDIIMVSGSGNFGRGGVDKTQEAEAIKKTFTEKYEPLLDKAIAAGVSFRVGNQYAKGNLSDELIAKYLQQKGFTEEKLNGYSRWSKPTQPSTQPTEKDFSSIPPCVN